MSTYCVSNYGFVTDHGFNTIPFFIVDGVIVNYAFVKHDGTYLTPIGKFKHACLLSINDTNFIDVDIKGDTLEQIKSNIRYEFTRLSFGYKPFSNAILFKIYSEVRSNDVAFYQGLGLQPSNRTMITFTESSLKSTGYPFGEYDDASGIIQFSDRDIVHH